MIIISVIKKVEKVINVIKKFLKYNIIKTNQQYKLGIIHSPSVLRYYITLFPVSIRYEINQLIHCESSVYGITIDCGLSIIGTKIDYQVSK